MYGKVILISDDKDFFEYLIPKLMLRTSDELFTYSFDGFIQNLHNHTNPLLIINSENNKKKTLELLDLVSDLPSIIFSYNDDSQFKTSAYKSGMFGFFTLSASIDEINALILPALKFISAQMKTDLYRNILIKNNVLMQNNEVFFNYNEVLDKQISAMKNTQENAVLMAIAPNDSLKFLINSHLIETVVLNNIRKNDILMNYAPKQYLLLLKDANFSDAENVWSKIKKNLPEGMFVGYTSVENKNSQSVINEVINLLQKSINNCSDNENSERDVFKLDKNKNFKTLKQDFNKRLEQIIYPSFFKIQQIYGDKLFETKITQKNGNDYWDIILETENLSGTFHITNPGCFAVNISISYSNSVKCEEKIIPLEQDEVEEGFLTDLLEQFVIEFKNLSNKGVYNNDYS